MRIVALLLVVLSLAGCDLLTGPDAGSAVFLVYGETIERVDLETGQVETVYDFGGSSTWALAVHESSLFTAARTEADGNFRLQEVDLCSMERQWTMELGSTNDPREVAGITFGYPGSISVPPDGTRLYLDEAYQDTTQGAVVLDRHTREPIGFIGPFEHRAVRELPPMNGYENGVIRVIGMRADDTPATLFFFDRVTFELMDSVPPGSLGIPQFWVAKPSVDGRTLYGSSIDELLRYDISRGEIVARYDPDAWLAGQVAEAPDGRLVALDWKFNRDYPGSGLVYVFDPDLELIGEVDISTPVGGEPYQQGTRAEWIKVSRDGETAYVAAVGLGNYGEQPARIFVIDLDHLSVRKVIEVGGPLHIGKIVLPPEC